MKGSRLVVVALSLLVLANGQAAWAQTREDVAAAAARWAAVFVDDNPDSILALYAPDAVLWGTLSPTLRQGPVALRSTSWRPSRRCPATRSASESS